MGREQAEALTNGMATRSGSQGMLLHALDLVATVLSQLVPQGPSALYQSHGDLPAKTTKQKRTFAV